MKVHEIFVITGIIIISIAVLYAVLDRIFDLPDDNIIEEKIEEVIEDHFCLPDNFVDLTPDSPEM